MIKKIKTTYRETIMNLVGIPEYNQTNALYPQQEEKNESSSKEKTQIAIEILNKIKSSSEFNFDEAYVAYPRQRKNSKGFSVCITPPASPEEFKRSNRAENL